MKLKKNQRGQVLVFYALMMPLIILFVGVGMDLGWYYLNVSRLQNAADAAARAGAISIVDDESNAFENYFSYLLAKNDLPADFDDYENIDQKNFGTLIHYYDKTRINDLLLRSRNSAENYTRLNLLDSETDFAESADLAETTSSSGGWKSLSTNNEWTFSTTAGDKNVTGNIALKYKLIDGKNDVYGTLYYVVELREKIPHFFMPGWFDKMDAEVRAVALLQPHDKDLLTIFQELERTKVIANWEYQNKFKGNPEFYGGKWNHYQAGQGSNKKVGIKYISGDTYRTESITVATTYKNSTANRTSANGGTFYSANEVDSINLDFRAETIKKFTSDWDLGQSITGQTYEFTEGWSATDGADKRILFNAEFNEAFPTRDSSLFADILWVRIESDPIKPLDYIGNASHKSYNTVRQITLNFNADNTETSSNHYTKRPYVVFYTGPENIDYKRDANGVLLRHSQPVVINLNADTNAIVYMPESPVIINGNNNKLTGFVIAKCFLSAVTSEDMKNGFTLYDGFNAPSKFNGGYIEVSNTDARTLYILSQDILNHDEILALNEGAQEVDTGNGLVSFYEEMQAPQYIFVNYTKNDHNQYLVTEDNKVNENKTFAAYINATYKEKFKAFSGLTDSQISAVSFPDENYNETTATYYVATSDLSDTQKDDSYVKVMVGNATKYVEKNKLPYVKVRTNNEYFYVCVYDLKLTTMTNSNGTGKGVRMINNNFTDEEITNSLKVNNKESVADVFVNPNNKYGDSWTVDRGWYDNNHYKNWKKDKLTFSEQNGITYFMLNSEITEVSSKQTLLNRYRKIMVGNDIQYINEDSSFYMKVQNNQDENGNNRNDNYIIVDKNGNILTKPITAPEVIKTKLVNDEEIFDVNTVASNDALKNKATSLIVPASDKALSDYWNTYTREPKDPEEIPGDIGQILNGRYVGLSQDRLNKDYRVPCLERVYKNTTFNLDSDSCYSYFQIPDLKLVNYLYLNVNELKHTVNGVASDNWKVDDMFFTKIRAGWID